MPDTETADPRVPREIKDLCPTCRLIHPPLVDCQQAMANNMRALLLRVGKLDRCKGCLADIFWVHHVNGANAPYTAAGLNHFIDCPFAESFHARKGKAS